MTRLVGYFGYGSLVNKNTLRTSYIDHIPVRLSGWQRHWEPRQGNDDPQIALLSVHAVPSSSILGMLVIDSEENLTAVDERETGYDRIKLDINSLEMLGSNAANYALPEQLYIYVAQKRVEEGDGPDARQQLLQSYTDAVLQGFNLEFGLQGVKHFAETTKGFERNLSADRSTPQYPRAVDLSPTEQVLFDETLKRAGVIFPN